MEYADHLAKVSDREEGKGIGLGTNENVGLTENNNNNTTNNIPELKTKVESKN